MNALTDSVARLLAPRPPRNLPPLHASPQRLGNGRVELLIYPAATTADRLAAARALLDGTAWSVTLRMEEGATRNPEASHAAR